MSDGVDTHSHQTRQNGIYYVSRHLCELCASVDSVLALLKSSLDYFLRFVLLFSLQMEFIRQHSGIAMLIVLFCFPLQFICFFFVLRSEPESTTGQIWIKTELFAMEKTHRHILLLFACNSDKCVNPNIYSSFQLFVLFVLFIANFPFDHHVLHSISFVCFFSGAHAIFYQS